MVNKYIEIGTGSSCITPQKPLGLAGYFNLRIWEKVLDDLEVRVVLFRQGRTSGGIIQFDLIGVPQILHEKIFAALKLAGTTELNPDNLILTAIHTHTAPEVRPGRQGYDTIYIDYIVERAVEAIQDALNGMKTCETNHGVATDRSFKFAFNRRYWMKDGEVLTNPGKLNPDILRPEGEIDPEIPIAAFCCEGKVKALLVNIINHSDTIGGCDISADWPGVCIKNLKQNLGENCLIMPLIGCSGNINHFNINEDSNQTCYQEAQRIGNGYAQIIRNTLPDLQPLETAELEIYSKKIRLSPRQISPQEILEAQTLIDKYPEIDVENLNGNDLTADDLAKKTPLMLKYFAAKLLETASKAKELEVNIHRLEFGNMVIAALPCEPFVELGLTLRKGIFRKHTAIITTLANGAGSGTGYIPNCWNYGRGGYETTPRSNPFAKDTAEKLFHELKGLKCPKYRILNKK